MNQRNENQRAPQYQTNLSSVKPHAHTETVQWGIACFHWSVRSVSIVVALLWILLGLALLGWQFITDSPPLRPASGEVAAPKEQG